MTNKNTQPNTSKEPAVQPVAPEPTTAAPEKTQQEQFSARVLDCIEERGTTVKPKWQFQAREVVLWVLIAAAVVIGSLAVAVIVSNVTDSDLPLYMRGGYHPLIAVGKLLPYFWIVLLILVAIAIEWNMKHTKKGYKFRGSTILICTVILSTGAGTALAILDIGRGVDESLERSLPLYAEYIAPHHTPWEDPEHGVLAGKIVLVGEEFLVLQTLRGDEWIVVLLEDDYKEVKENRLIRAVGERKAYTELTIDWSSYNIDDDNVDLEYVFYASEWKQRKEDAPFGKKGKKNTGQRPGFLIEAQLAPAK